MDEECAGRMRHAAALFERGDAESAATLFGELAVESRLSDEDRAVSLVNLATVYTAMGRHDDALATLNRAVTAEGGHGRFAADSRAAWLGQHRGRHAGQRGADDTGAPERVGARRKPWRHLHATVVIADGPDSLTVRSVDAFMLRIIALGFGVLLALGIAISGRTPAMVGRGVLAGLVIAALWFGVAWLLERPAVRITRDSVQVRSLTRWQPAVRLSTVRAAHFTTRVRSAWPRCS